VLDEADRILDLGFSRTLAALLNHLPKSRQTLLFSATQTSSVSDLARLSLNNPVPIGISSELSASDPAPTSNGPTALTTAMPTGLTQHYTVVPLDQKLSMLFSFLRTHTKSKCLVFLSSTKQVRHVFATFSHLRPGLPLLHLHGKQKTAARLGTYEKFARATEGALFATDVAARGLDFAGVEWVVQVDAPGDVEGYVHRVGRTARYEREGKALLMLCPSEEEGMIETLKARGIEVGKIRVKENKVGDVSQKMQEMAWKVPEVKYLAQRVGQITFVF
jgi:ATP-dependent RNA helicase DDX10/DBP4